MADDAQPHTLVLTVTGFDCMDILPLFKMIALWLIKMPPSTMWRIYLGRTLLGTITIGDKDHTYHILYDKNTSSLDLSREIFCLLA